MGSAAQWRRHDQQKGSESPTRDLRAGIRSEVFFAMSRADRIIAWMLSALAVGGGAILLVRLWSGISWLDRIGVIVVACAMSRYPWVQGVKERRDNPRCFCPDCGADLGSFYSNRIVMRREKR
jgi:hypothetical protein